jgi:membrane-associated phospholipid phosphatase
VTPAPPDAAQPTAAPIAEPFEQARRSGGLRSWLNALDLAVYRGFRNLAPGGVAMDRIKLFSKAGEHGACWYALGLAGAAVDRRQRGHWLEATATVAVAYGTSTAIKNAIGRKRPAVEDLPAIMRTPTGLSFPSSHSTSSFAAARAFSSLLPGPPLYAVATAMATSRLLVGVHYPSDIVAGVALGMAMGECAR